MNGTFPGFIQEPDGGAGAAGHTFQDEGVAVPGGPHTIADFVGAGVTAANAGGGKVTITIPGGVTDHGALTGLADDDHLQYLRLLGRAGGQLAHGGTAATEELGLRGSLTADLGRVRVYSPFEIDDVSAGDTVAFRYRPTWTQSAAFIGGLIISQPTVTINPGAAVFIPTVLGDSAIFKQNTVPGFAVYTLANILPNIQNLGNFNLMGALVFNVGVTHQRTTAGTSTTSQTFGMNFSPQIKTSAFGAVMTRTLGVTAVNVQPTHSTVFGSTVNYGTVRGLHGKTPVAGFLQPQAGTENMTAYILVDMDNIPFGGNVTKAAVRSNQAAATNAFFLLQTGSCQSRFIGEVQHRSNVNGSKYGTLDEFGIRYNGTQAEFQWSGGDSLYWQNFPVSNYWEISSPVDQGIQMALERIVHGQTAADLAGNGFFLSAPGARSTNLAGEYVEHAWSESASGPTLAHNISTMAMAKFNKLNPTRGGFGLDVLATVWIPGNNTAGDENFGIYAPDGRHHIKGYHRRSAAYAGYN